MVENSMDGVPEFYTDALRVNLSPWTMTLEFGIRDMPPTDDLAPNTRPIARVRMSPHHAKAMITVLESILVPWEAENGPIKMPELVVHHFESREKSVHETEENGGENE